MYKSEIFVINMHHHRNSLANIHINNNKDINNLYNVNVNDNVNNKNHGNYKIVSNTNNNNMNGYINSHANIRKKIFLNVTSKLNRS